MILRSFRGACDASAAVPAGPYWLTANDEDNVIRVYWRDHRSDRPLARIDLTPHVPLAKDPEADFEGAAELDGVVYWTGSHGHSTRGQERPARRVLLATRVRLDAAGMPSLEVLGSCTSLVEAIAAFDHPAARLIARRAERGPEDGGVDVEGLAAWQGGLLVGLRSPLRKRRALLVHLANPLAAATGAESPRIAAIHDLDLDGRGVRAMEAVPGALLVLAGSAGAGRGPAVYRWTGVPGDPPVPVIMPALPRGFRPEGLVVTREDQGATLHVFSDEGHTGGTPCKARPPMGRRFRVLEIALTTR